VSGIVRRTTVDSRPGGKDAKVSQIGLREVAALAGVSIKTVSNVINDRPHVTPETRARVEEAVRRLDYRPNLYARALRGGRSGVIALALPTLDSPYFAEVAHSIVRAAAARQWTVFIDETDGDPARELSVIRGLGPHLIDGLIFSPLSLGPVEITSQRVARPLVMLGERCLDGRTDHVVIDNVAAARMATHHLYDLGRRRIAAIGDQPRVATDTARLRVAGYRAALAEVGLPAATELVKQADAFTREEGARLMAQLLDLRHPPDAVFCFNDLLAIGAMYAARVRGFRVPDDVAVIGFDDVGEGRFANPSLSTVSPDKEAIGEFAVSLIERRLAPGSAAGEPPPAEEITVGAALTVRESTGGPAPDVAG
jgi:DNA-binding LacI/PurR family transcriptional regulator